MKLTRSRLAAGLVAVTLVGSLAACNTGQNDTSSTPAGSASAKSGPLTISYLQKQGDQQYFVDEANGAKQEASKLGNVTVNIVNLGTDANKAISEVDAAIARKVDGIIIVVPDQAIGPQVIDKARQANIPILASDDIIKDSSGAAIPFAGFNGTAMGTEVGKKAVELYQAAGWTASDTRIIAAWKQDLSVCTQRTDGAKAAFTQAVGADKMPKIIEVGTDNSVTDALNKTGAVYTANQGVKHWVVWGCNDENETGAVTALQNAGVNPDNIIGVGLGAYLTCKDWKANQNTGNKAALYISGVDVGAAAVQAMVAQLRDGKQMPAETIAKTYMVDKSNYQSVGVTCT